MYSTSFYAIRAKRNPFSHALHVAPNDVTTKSRVTSQPIWDSLVSPISFGINTSMQRNSNDVRLMIRTEWAMINEQTTRKG